MQNLTNKEWTEAVSKDESSVVIDVRTDDEVAEGIIEKAMQLDIHQPQAFMEGLNDLDKNKNYYVYCRAGSRSSQACQIMEQLGFQNTFNLTDGFSNWDGPVAHSKQ
jgi:rhodanese-related sulfurtransferase